MDFQDLSRRALDIRRAYAELERHIRDRRALSQ